ncbi:hypothetical protein AWQ21_02255 [Picosynechococcus sp. PCC 7003]|uniref:hypothetical protein n=1 Tax=Picosynechococcus sp. PCC 7003 TaxID=374981 RepID=UPI000810DB87|nr:hypothetical protein [Picosynechococcus sp. PCC 7003]ANV83302.1 hypothetical protein AWQ21_02255 [Picosynechococcus sp. PCC 7003]
MTIIKIPKTYLLQEDQENLTFNLPEEFINQVLTPAKYEVLKRTKGILKEQRQELLKYSQTVRQEWD